ncbi:unnamed protein product [Auanema sp. JU1783]|nr:unnamed protein product [Auanema sp. JU1783]
MDGFCPDEMKTDPTVLQDEVHGDFPTSQDNVDALMREGDAILNLDRDMIEPVIDTSNVPASTSEVPASINEIPASTNEVPASTSTASHDYAAVVEENAAYERTNFTLSTELGNVKEQVVHLSNQNIQLQQQIASSENELQERSRLFRQMESSRNELSYKCTGLEAESMKLKSEKEERDSVIKILTREKHDVLLENQKLSQELKDIANEKANLAIHIKSLDQEKRAIAFEKEQATRNKALYEESKKWFLKEMVEKDNTIAKIRLEISSSALKWQNEKMEYAKQVKELKVQLNKVQDILQIKEESLTKSIASIEEREAEHRKEIQNLERELRASKELTELYKDSMDKAEQCAAEFREALMTKESLARSTKVLIEELRSEMEEEKNTYFNDLSSKTEKIRELEEELEKANQMLKNRHAVSLNLTEDELANLSPAAAETSRFVKGGMTLTSMMREQARLAGELAAERERNQQLDQAMREIVEDIETSAPQLLNQKQQIDKMFDENTLLRDQLETADINRYKLESSKDAAVRELAFTRAELEKFQRDLMDLSRKHQHLLFVMEKERMLRDTNSPPPSEDDDRQLYENIVQLQKRNMQLESELASEKASAGQAQITAQNTEMEKLRRELETYVSTNTRLSSQLEQMQTAFDTLQEQSQRLSALVEDNVSAAEARAARQKAEDLSAELRAAEMKVSRLEETVSYLREEKASSNKTSEEKIGAYQATINELTLTRAKLEAEFEQQKQISLASMKEIELLDKEVKRVQKEYEQLSVTEQDTNNKLTEMTEKHIELHDNLGEYKIKCTVLQSELSQNTITIGRLEAQLEMFKTKEFTDKGMMESISEISRRLNSIEAEKLVRKEQRMELIEMENNSLKSAASRASAQLATMENEAKVQQFKLEQHISLLGQQLNEKEEQLRFNEIQLAELRVRLASVQSQYSNEDSTEDMSPERLKKECQQLKNRTQYLESQCEELKNKLALAEVEVSRKEDEMIKLTTHSGKMETGLVEAQKVGELERVRLESRVQAAEGRADSLSETVGELRKQVDEKSAELLNVNIERLKEVNELQQKLDVQKQLLTSNEEEIKIWKNSVENIKEEMEKKDLRYSKINDEIESAQNDLLAAQAKVSSLENLLRAEQEACAQAKETAKIAEDARESIQVSLEHMTKKIEEDDKTWREMLERSNSQVADLVGKYEAVVSKLTTDDLTKIDPEAPQAVMTSQQGVITFLRDEKDAAFNRAMNSEIEVLRLRSEIKELSVRCDQLVATNQKLSIENVSGNAALAEKADMLKRIEELLGFQQQYMRLRGEKDRLLQVCTENQKKIKETDSEMEKLREQRNYANNICKMKEAEVTSLTKETEILKTRIESLQKEKTTELRLVKAII